MPQENKSLTASRIVDSTARRYVLAGLLVTAASYAFLISLSLFTRTEAVLANVATLLFGLAMSFLLNRNFVFRHSGNTAAALARFGLVVTIAYSVNLGVLQVLLSQTNWPQVLVQFIAFSVYSVIAYVLHRLWTFAEPKA